MWLLYFLLANVTTVYSVNEHIFSSPSRDDLLEAYSRPFFPRNVDKLDLREIARRNPNCDGPNSGLWDEIHRNITTYLKYYGEHDLEAKIKELIPIDRSPWMYVMTEEFHLCPLGAVTMRIFLKEVFGTVLSRYWDFELKTIFETPASIWMPSKWGKLISIQIKFAAQDLVMNTPDPGVRYVHDELQLQMTKYAQPVLFWTMEEPQHVNKANTSFSQFLTAFIGSENFDAFAVQSATQALHVIRTCWKNKDCPAKSLVAKAWKVLDLYQIIFYRSLEDVSTGLYGYEGVKAFWWTHVLYASPFFELLNEVLFEMRFELGNMISTLFEVPDTPLKKAYNPISARETGDVEYLPLHSCSDAYGLSNLVQGGTRPDAKYQVKVIGASAHRNTAIDDRFMVVKFGLWAEKLLSEDERIDQIENGYKRCPSETCAKFYSKTEEEVQQHIEQGFRAPLFTASELQSYGCEPFDAAEFLSPTCAVTLPNGQIYKTLASLVSPAGWVRPSRHSWECIVPREAREIKVEDMDESWSEPIVIKLCEIENKVKSTICLRQLFEMGPKHHELLEHFLHYHLSMGFDHVNVYDIDGTADSPLLQELIARKKVTYVSRLDEHMSPNHGRMVQLQTDHIRTTCQAVALNHCFLQNQGKADWIFLIRGIDKFVTSSHGPNTLSHFFNKYDKSHAKYASLAAGALNFRHDDEDADASLPVFLRKRRAMVEYDKVWCPILTPHTHYVTQLNSRPREGYITEELDIDEFRVNHYQAAFGKAGQWRKGEKALRDEIEPYMDWGWKWIQDCKAKSCNCPYYNATC